MKEVALAVFGFLFGSWMIKEYISKDDPALLQTSPLFLTPFITSGDTKSATKQATVDWPFNRNFENSYSGFITVNATCNANLFFWFFLSKRNPSVDPLILFLNGGPGDPSSAAVFEGAGPFFIHKNSRFLDDNPYSWNDGNNVIFVDSPVGTGFSFTEDDSCYARTLQDVAESLFQFLIQFYGLFKDYKSNPLFLSGVNYSAKDVLHLARLLHDRNASKNNTDFNLKGLILGSPFLDPLAQLDRSEFLYQLGFVDRNTRDHLAKETDRIREDWKHKRQEDLNPYEFQNHLKLISQLTGGVSNLNYLKDESDFEQPKTRFQLFEEPRVRHALHVGDTVHSEENTKARSAFRWTLMQSVKTELEFLLDHYKVMIYSGQLDATVPYPGLAKTFYNLNWTYVKQYRTSLRQTYSSGKEIGSFIKTYDNLIECMLRKAGHYVLKDNPEHLSKLVYQFTNNKLEDLEN